VRWARSCELTDEEDGGYLGDGGFFVSLRTGQVEQLGSGDVMNAWAILRVRDGLPADVEPPVDALAEILARYPPDELRRRALSMPRP
jgi:hypothetical protein